MRLTSDRTLPAVLSGPIIKLQTMALDFAFLADRPVAIKLVEILLLSCPVNHYRNKLRDLLTLLPTCDPAPSLLLLKTSSLDTYLFCSFETSPTIS